MAKVRYIPEPGAPETHDQFGRTWGPDAVDVPDDDKVLFKLRGSPFYEVDGVRAEGQEPDKSSRRGVKK